MSKVIRLETGEEPERFFDLEEEKSSSGLFDGKGASPPPSPPTCKPHEPA